ncbi:hypothetical protein [Salinactinospora qingdaonensis]|uniref:Tetratricopeptide repeat-containing protein n=1 Tax=Salinactinospora qingdaonensis TaxID=702744 RepID=A0ABP7FKG5_9ACTN
MTATHDDHAFDAPDFASLCDQARDLAESGHLTRAAQVYEQVVDAGAPERYRAQAALGLAVVRHDMGEIDAARRADLLAVETAHPEYAARAAYHLAVSYESTGELGHAEEAWSRVLDLGNERYTPAAHHGLARMAEEQAAPGRAREHWQQALAGGAAGTEAAVTAAARDYAERLLARGESATAEEVIQQGLAARDDAGLRLLLGAVHVEHAIGAFSSVVAEANAETEPESQPAVPAATTATAVELLARLLAVRGDATGAAEVWEGGLDQPAEVAAEVRARLRRGFLQPDPEEVVEGGEEQSWWEPYVEAAVLQDSAPMLTGELFVALSRMYATLAAPLAAEEYRSGQLREALEEAVLLPGQYVWGRDLYDDFRDRLRRAAGSATHVLPEGWPYAR